MPTHYEVLNVDPGAGEETIRTVCEEMLKQCYADLRNPATHDESIGKIKRIIQARDTLLDRESREKYDGKLLEREEEVRTLSPWRRFFARYLDQLIFLAVFFPVYRYLADYVFFEDWALALEAAGVGIALYILLETAATVLFGGTPGKWMLSISVISADGQKPKRVQRLRRNLMAVLFGFGLYILPVSIVTMLLQERRISKKESGGLTTWDRACGTVVQYGDMKAYRFLVLPVVVAVFVCLLVIF
jgi:uncharacterized RDD family membrane protein YckC